VLALLLLLLPLVVVVVVSIAAEVVGKEDEEVGVVVVVMALGWKRLVVELEMESGRVVLVPAKLEGRLREVVVVVFVRAEAEAARMRGVMVEEEGGVVVSEVGDADWMVDVRGASVVVLLLLMEEAGLLDGEMGLVFEMPNCVVSTKSAVRIYCSFHSLHALTASFSRDGEPTLVLSVRVHNQLDPIVRDIGLKIRSRRPHVVARVRDLFDNGVQRDDVLGGPAEEEQCDGAGGRGRPCDDEGRAHGDLLVEAWCGDGVAGRGGAYGGGVGGDEGGEEGG